MGFLSIISGLLKLAGALMGYLQDRQLLDAGAKAQLSRELIALNDRINKAVKIQQEERTDNENIDILRGGGRKPPPGGVSGEPPPGTG